MSSSGKQTTGREASNYAAGRIKKNLVCIETISERPIERNYGGAPSGGELVASPSGRRYRPRLGNGLSGSATKGERHHERQRLDV